MYKRASSYIAQYPVLRTTQSALHFTSMTDLFTQTPSRLLWEVYIYNIINNMNFAHTLIGKSIPDTHDQYTYTSDKQIMHLNKRNSWW